MSPASSVLQNRNQAAQDAGRRRDSKIRLTLDVSSELNDVLQSIADAEGCSKSDVLRRAVVLMKVVKEANSQGKKVGIASEGQSLQTEFVGI